MAIVIIGNKKFKELHKNCLRCGIKFNTAWLRKLYCSRKCYLIGVTERRHIWDKTKEGKLWRKKFSIDLHRSLRIQAIKKLGSKCKQCGFSDIRALHIDHINNDGKSERSTRKTMYKKIAREENDISRYQLLCANCNWIKRIENNKDLNKYLLSVLQK